MSKTLVFMRTHIISKGVISEFLKLKNSTDYDCILFIDNHKKIIPGDFNEPVQNLDFFDGLVKDIKCFLFDENIFSSFKLPYYAKKNKKQSLSKIMWCCGDYTFYAIKKYFPEYDFYWHFDNDVFCNGKSYSDFFKRYENNNSDLLVNNLSKIDYDSTWWILGKSEWMYGVAEKYSSFFPIVRLSAPAIDFLYKKRIEHKEIFQKLKRSKKNRWINCELFVPTELLNNGFTGENIMQPLRFLPEYDLNEDRIFETPDNLIYHPVKGNFLKRLDSMKFKFCLSLRLCSYEIGFFIRKK